MKKILPLIILLCLEIPFSAYAESELVNLHGIVVDIITNKPITDAIISIYDYDSDFEATVTTDENGCWSILFPSGHNYDLTTYAAGYYTEDYYSWGEDDDTEINFSLCPEALPFIIKGRVIDALNNQPISNESISINYLSYDEYDITNQHNECTTNTDKEGYYHCEFIGEILNGIGYNPQEYEVICGRNRFDSYHLTPPIFRGILFMDDWEAIIEDGQLKLLAEVNFKIYQLSEDAGLVDGIKNISTNNYDTKHYSVSGTEIAPTTKGLHIVNGKKIIVK